MSFTVYIIYTKKLEKYYIGYTEDVSKRMLQHNEGISTFTSKAADWTLKYTRRISRSDISAQTGKGN